MLNGSEENRMFLLFNYWTGTPLDRKIRYFSTIFLHFAFLTNVFALRFDIYMHVLYTYPIINSPLART